MADLDYIDICLECLIPVEGKRKCPNCNNKLTRIASLAFETMRILKDKGWKPTSCNLHGYGSNRTVSISFDGHTPSRGVHGEMRCQLNEKDGAVCSTWREKTTVGAYREAHEWADEASTFKHDLPFNLDLCSKCSVQHPVEWLHGICQCPCAGLVGSEKPGATGPYGFYRGFPEKCIYLAEQVMTRHKVAISLGVVLE